MAQIARGLEAAHRKSIFHRDIKPANVMLLDQGSDRLVKIMDFGLAQLAERSRLTDLDTTLGTMAYMSPEQTEGAGTDQRTDLWALGCVMYEMISGQLPFRGDYNQAVQYSILHEAPEPLTGLRTGVPMELEWIVDKCLAKNREERYPEASALILDVGTLRKKLEGGRSTVAQTTRPPLPSELGPPAAESMAAVTAASTVHIDDVGADRDARLKRQEQIDGFLAGGMITFAAGIGISIFLYFLIPDKPVFLTGVIAMLVGAALLGLAYLMANRPSE